METTDASVIAREGVRERVDVPLTGEDRANLFRYLVMMRASEERALTLYKQGKVPGSFYDGRGQEAISSGGSRRIAISPTTWAAPAASPAARTGTCISATAGWGASGWCRCSPTW